MLTSKTGVIEIPPFTGDYEKVEDVLLCHRLEMIKQLMFYGSRIRLTKQHSSDADYRQILTELFDKEQITEEKCLFCQTPSVPWIRGSKGVPMHMKCFNLKLDLMKKHDVALIKLWRVRFYSYLAKFGLTLNEFTLCLNKLIFICICKINDKYSDIEGKGYNNLSFGYKINETAKNNFLQRMDKDSLVLLLTFFIIILCVVFLLLLLFCVLTIC